ncbi:toprim domain-containing protein [Catenibacterium mitsuokai]|uniref:toprim domain-containing protein n=1 Tax=Catenibacterium mitsuokai TaxID=100886 RepID=UPI003F8B6770
MAKDQVQTARRNAVRGYPISQLAEEYGMTLVKKRGRRPILSTVEHDSIVIYEDDNTYHRYSNGNGGDAVAFMMEFSGIDESDLNKHEQVNECIRILEQRLKINPELAVQQVRYKREKPKFVMPEKADTNRKVRDYLCRTRGIEERIVDKWIHEGLLFQEAGRYGNCVFVSRDKNGKPVYGVKRSADPKRKFVVDLEGSDYSQGFFIKGKLDYYTKVSDNFALEHSSLFVTEAVIDLMSLQSLYLRRRDYELRQQGKLDCDPEDYENRFLNSNWYSLNGCRKYDGLLNTIASHKGIKDIFLALDNDEAGRNASKTIKEEIQKRFPDRKIDVSIRVPPTEGRDWNDELKAGFSLSARDDALMDLQEKYGRDVNELYHQDEYRDAVKFRMYHPRNNILPVNAKDYVEEMIEGIGYFTADTPVFSVLESDYEPARKITGIPVAEADKILKEITKRIANDDKVESAVARFRIDYVIDGMHRNYQGDFLLKSDWAESPGIIEHIRQFNYRCIHDSRFDKMDPKYKDYLNYAYNRLVPYLEKHVQVYEFEKLNDRMAEKEKKGDIPDDTDPNYYHVCLDIADQYASRAKRLLNEGLESEIRRIDTSGVERMIKYGVNPGELDINYQYVMAVGERMEMEDDNVKSYDIVPSTESEVKDEQKVNLKNDRTVQQGYNRPYQSRRRR